MQPFWHLPGRPHRINCAPICQTLAFTGTGRTRVYLNGRFSPQNPTGGLSTWVKVEFGDVRTNGLINSDPNADVTRTVSSVGGAGYANVMLGNLPTGGNYDNCFRMSVPGDNKYLLCSVRLDETGMIANQIVLKALGPDAVLWDVNNVGGDFVGFVDERTFNDQPLTNTFLEFVKVITPSQTCNDPIDTNTHMVGHIDWPLLIVPKDTFTYTQGGIQWTSICTRYRSSRYSDLELYTEDNPAVDNTPHEPTDSGNQLENAGFLKPTYTASTFDYVNGSGFSGTLVLVGMLQAATYFDPKRNPDNSLRKRNEIFYKIYRHGYRISTREQYDSTKALPIELTYSVQNQNEGLATYFRTVLSNYLLEYCNSKGIDLYNSGLKIYTTIDSRLQKYAEEAVAEHMKPLQEQFYEEWKKRGRNPWIDDDGKEIKDFLQRRIRQTDAYKIYA